MSDILLITAHPHLEHSRVNRTLMDAAAAVDRVEVRDIYSLYPDYLIDVAAEQEALDRAQLVIWQHPLHWYHMPPLMKLWVDEVLAFGWSYGPQGQALRGKDLWLIASTGGTEDSYRPEGYNRYHFDAFLPPYEQTATLCGMRFLPPLVLHGAHHVSGADLARQVQTLTDRLIHYPDWPELADMDECVACEVPVSARPQDVPDDSVLPPSMPTRPVEESA